MFLMKMQQNNRMALNYIDELNFLVKDSAGGGRRHLKTIKFTIGAQPRFEVESIILVKC